MKSTLDFRDLLLVKDSITLARYISYLNVQFLVAEKIELLKSLCLGVVKVPSSFFEFTALFIMCGLIVLYISVCDNIPEYLKSASRVKYW